MATPATWSEPSDSLIAGTRRDEWDNPFVILGQSKSAKPTGQLTGRSLIPAIPLQDGEQYRFHFDMSRCIGCKCCEVACAEQNNLPPHISWRRVGEVRHVFTHFALKLDVYRADASVRAKVAGEWFGLQDALAALPTVGAKAVALGFGVATDASKRGRPARLPRHSEAADA